ncbi:RNA-directed DNA polymerase [Mesorhizobium sp.]|uniref:RNA-directed DNA polymerase n=1 Tax=Mesorhizobium sp. TaxID=1871066 RepID=UPI0025E190DB|nr:RNA-directed DNA polymerase [Mesorhizobium sp.]
MIEFTGDDPNVFAERMLENGYIPENVPPPFRIENLHEAYLTYAASGEYITGKVPTESTRYNASKRNRQRRIFSMPNPVFMIDCVKYFIDRADQIDEHFSLSSDSCSKPVFIPSGSRALQIDSFNDFYLKRRRTFSTSRYIVKCDISRFYHSIYTHCIPWALHGKGKAKADRKVDSDSIFGNRLDFTIRQSQDGQTVGIPVGPDFSRLISEIVATRIDASFRSTAGADVPVLRLVDDIYLGADNLDEAYGLLGVMRDSIRELELDINEAKTVVIDASRDFESPWPVHIRQSIDRFKEYKQSLVPEFIHVLDEIISISIDKNDDGIIKYALRKLDNELVWVDYWEAIEPFLIRCCISFPHSWDYVAQIVSLRNAISGIDKSTWSRAINKSLAQNVRTGHDFEVTWSLWLARQLKIEIDDKIFEQIFEKCGSFSMLVALDVHKNSGMACKVPKQTILSRLGDKPCLGPFWLLAFEADRQFDLKIKTKNLQGHDFFKSLYDDDVSFYDSDFEFFDTDDLLTTGKTAIKKTTSYDDSEIDEIEDDF